MTRLARWCFVHRRRVVAGWLILAVIVIVLGQAAGSAFNSDFNLPHTDSQDAVNLLKRSFPAASGENDQVVFATRGTANLRGGAARSAAQGALRRVAAVKGVQTVESPFARGGGAQISRDGTVGFATVLWKMSPAKVTTADANRLIDAARAGGAADLQVSLGGQAIENAQGSGPGLSVIVGVAAALIILLIVFGGALWASLMPLVTAALALVIAGSAIDLLTHAMDVPSVASDLAVLIGLGVGVDYGLFIISRHRTAIKSGLSYEDAVSQAVNTSGRTVLFAGATVCVALLGQFALGVSFLYGLSLASALAVALTMATSLTFLPAMLGFLGPRVLARRDRRTLAAHDPFPSEAGGLWLRWARIIQRRPLLAGAGALAVVVVIAFPLTGLRLGSSDAGTDPSGYTTHQAYAALARGFGPGFNGPMELVAEVHARAGDQRFGAFLHAAAKAPGVASVGTPISSPDHRVMLATLYPTTSPQAAQTATLVSTLRNRLVPRFERGGSLRIHVGGETATDIDFSHALTDKLPLFIAVVVLLAFVLLVAVFRSLLIPLVASIMNLLSVGAALGALNAAFNWGWLVTLLGLPGTSPIDAFIPVLLFSVLFGLSTDYEVYLVSRIREQWETQRTDPADHSSPQGRNHHAILIGQAESGRIVVGAASIMILVFGSFLLNGDRILEEFGFGLGFAVLVDALIIRSVLVPAIMHLVGPRNWALPHWLDRAVPNLSIESAPDAPAAADRTALPSP
jgi:RND superfamily putative drug exporter